MNIKQAYYYLFYKFYKVAMTGAIKSLSSFGAGVGVMVLEVWFLFSLYNYYTVCINRHATFDLTSFKVILSLIVVVVINYFAFDNSDKWKDYVAEFDQWPRRKNIIGSWIVIGIVAFVLANLVFSFYLMSQINWKLYR